MLKITSALRAIIGSLFLVWIAPVMAAGEVGEWWEVTMKMDMPGMPPEMAGMMPAQKNKICMTTGDEKQPVAQPDKNSQCKMSDLKQSGNTMTFKMACTGKDPMTGSGEITRTANSFSQKINVQSGDGDMTMVSNGKRLGGACEKGAIKNEEMDKLMAAQARAQEKQARDNAARCQNALENNDYADFLKAAADAASKAQCSGLPPEGKKSCEAMVGSASCAKLRPKMCEKLSADIAVESSYVKVAGEQHVAKLAGECGLPFDKKTQQYCKAHLDKKDWQFVGDFCRQEAAVMALHKQHCVGRDYTSVSNQHREMCSELGFGGRRGSASHADEDDSQADPNDAEAASSSLKDEVKKEAVNEGVKKALKGMFKL